MVQPGVAVSVGPSWVRKKSTNASGDANRWVTEVAPEERNWWVVIGPDDVDPCMFDPGHPVTATVETDLRTLTRSGAASSPGHSPVARARWTMTVTPQPA